MILRDRGHLVAALIGYCNINAYSTRLNGDVFIFLYTVRAGSPDGFNTDIVPGFGLTDGDYDIDTTTRVVTVFLDRITYYPNRGVADYCENGISRKISHCNNSDEVIASQNRLMFAPQNNNSSNNSATNTNNIKHTKRMEKIIFSESLINRLNAAKANGSIFADIILKERKKKHSEAIPNSIANHFDTVLVKNCGIPSQLKVSCCNKVDDDRNPNHGNPQFPYLSQNRTRLELWNFALLFNEVEKASLAMSAADLDYQTKLFQETMLIGEKITFRVGTTVADFEFAYKESSYLPFKNEGTLQNSCMRYDNRYPAAANFYSFFAGAKILIGQTASGQVVSRAVLWDGITDVTADNDDNITCFIERVYVSHSHLVKRMQDEALRLGYTWRKTKNDYSSQRQFTNMVTGKRMEHDVYKVVPANKWHKGGAPYCDTMVYILYVNGELHLANSNYSGGEVLYTLQSTDGCGYSYKRICPVCGSVHDSGERLCRNCRREYEVTTFDANTTYKDISIIDGVAYPKGMVKRGKLTKLARLVMQIDKIGEYYCA